ncbi:hypothetical protein RRG08_060429 [Elysia crispata]|uniref:Uncharacterized protein n=1 Tax=Elysia crispata TaxID=231223 RepID=A0AAE1AMJ6_9GAST|nr:hypothetical protein RRG08_060429 [Elysia crispata]
MARRNKRDLRSTQGHCVLCPPPLLFATPSYLMPEDKDTQRVSKNRIHQDRVCRWQGSGFPMVVVSLFSTEPTARLAVQKVFNGSCLGENVVFRVILDERLPMVVGRVFRQGRKIHTSSISSSALSVSPSEQLTVHWIIISVFSSSFSPGSLSVFSPQNSGVVAHKSLKPVVFPTRKIHFGRSD